LDSFFQEIQNITTIKEAKKSLFCYIKFSNQLNMAVDFCVNAHKNQFRKSGEPYAVHPILVATLVAKFSKDEAMVIAGLLHDVVEDTQYTIFDIEENFGNDVAKIVDGLTKIDIAKLEVNKTNSKTLSMALTFRKILLASIKDVRILVIKLCDRVHNMLTLNSLASYKQRRIAEETLVVYAPIAHRLGISLIKNTLEDLSFFYLYPEEYEYIDNYIKKYQQKFN